MTVKAKVGSFLPLLFVISASSLVLLMYMTKCYRAKIHFSDIISMKHYLENTTRTHTAETLLGNGDDVATSDNETEFSVNGIPCRKTAEINLTAVSSTSILRDIPPSYFKHLEKQRTYPACGMIYPWVLDEQLQQHELWMLVLVKSAPQNIRRRNAVRKAWGGIRALKGKRLLTIFVIASPGDHSEKKEALEAESKVYGDLVQCDFKDSYRALPLKMLSLFAWVVGSSIHSPFYILTDDDLVLKMDKIYEFYTRKENFVNESHMYCGFAFSARSGPIRNPRSKWYLDAATYPGKKYPAFCNGPMYSMTRPLMKELICMAAVTPYTDAFYLEDVLITGVIRELLGHNNANIEGGGGFVQYFWNQKGGVQNQIALDWEKKLAPVNGKDSPLKSLLQANGSEFLPFKMNEEIKELEVKWDKFK